MKTIRLKIAALLLAPFVFGSMAQAAHISEFTSIDAIDGVAPAGGGAFSGFLSAPGDDDWVAFFATAGDNVSVGLTTTAAFTDAAIFLESSNGIVEVGDVAGVINLNSDRTGAGTDLVIQHGGWTAFNNYTFQANQGLVTLNYTVATTGWHVLGLTINNEDPSRTGRWTADLSGNTGTAAVAEPGALALFGLGLLGMGLARRRRA